MGLNNLEKLGVACCKGCLSLAEFTREVLVNLSYVPWHTLLTQLTHIKETNEGRATVSEQKFSGGGLVVATHRLLRLGVRIGREGPLLKKLEL